MHVFSMQKQLNKYFKQNIPKAVAASEIWVDQGVKSKFLEYRNY